MKKNNYGFTLTEIIITLVITSILLIILITIYPNLVSTFWKQKKDLLFQQSVILDNFYLNKKTSSSLKVIDSYSSGSISRYNSYLTLLNKQWDLHYSVVYLWDESWKILTWNKKQSWKLIVKNDFFYSSFVQVWSDIYFTNPWQHTINKYSSWGLVSEVVYWVSWSYWYSNIWSWLFNTPTWITSDGSNLYISDTGNNVIRKINLLSWWITKITWIQWKSWYNEWETLLNWTNNSDILFDSLTSIYYDNYNLYISDTYNNRIRRIDLTSFKAYTIVWWDIFWFNNDIWNVGDININYPLSLIKTGSGIVFSDTLNWKIRYYDDLTKEIKTIVWLENINNYSKDSLSKYSKNFFISNIQSYFWWFYFNDLYNSVIYKYDFWDWIIWNADDTITRVLWNTDKNILINWDIENDLMSIWTNNDINIPDNDLFFSTEWDYIYPISGKKCLEVSTFWKYASWIINFSSNPNDWDLLQIYDKIFEFDDWNLIYNPWNIVIPIWNDLNETLDNLLTELLNYNIKSKLEWNKLFIIYNDYWNIWNNAIFSWTSLSYDFNPNWWKLSWWLDYSSEKFSFYFEKKLKKDEKYKLSFYLSSDSRLISDVLNPILVVNTWTWNEDQKIINIDNKWFRKEIVFVWNWDSQKIEFIVKSWVKVYFDNIKLTPTSNIENLDLANINNFKLQSLSNFFINSFWEIFLWDINNNRILLLDWLDYKIINNNFYIFDVNTFTLNLKNDYLWNSMLENLNFEKTDNRVIYTLWKSDYKLKISNNIK